MICDKTKYNSANEAHKAAVGISAKTGKGMKTYSCSDCGGFHLTTIKPNNRQSRILRNEKYKPDYSWAKPEVEKPKVTGGKKKKPQKSILLTTYKPFAYLRNII